MSDRNSDRHNLRRIPLALFSSTSNRVSGKASTKGTCGAPTVARLWNAVKDRDIAGLSSHVPISIDLFIASVIQEKRMLSTRIPVSTFVS
jgi:hypothetical protein